MSELPGVTQGAVKLICPLMVFIESTLKPGETMTLQENQPNLVVGCGSGKKPCAIISEMTTYEQVHAAIRMYRKELQNLGFAPGDEYDPRAYLALITLLARTCWQNPNRR